jgi:hypothetical protein
MPPVVETWNAAGGKTRIPKIRAGRSSSRERLAVLISRYRWLPTPPHTITVHTVLQFDALTYSDIGPLTA